MSTYSTSSIPQGIAIYANATLFPVTAQDGEQAVAADTNTLYIYDTSVPGWQAVANPGAAIAIDALTGEVTATGPGVVAATITNAAVTNAKLAAMADNTVKGNKSGAPASPSDLALSDVAETVSSVLTITNGSKAVVSPANLTIQVLQSSALQSGYLSSADWSTFNSKQNALTFGNLSGDMNANISVSGGTGAVIGMGTSISQSAATALAGGYLTSTDWSTFNNKVGSVSGSAPISSSGGTTPTISISQSGAATDGYLSSTDWNTFNSKQPAGNYITALTSDVTATGPGSVAATVAFVGGKTSSEVATSVTDTQNATALSTASTLMERDGSGETALDGLSLDGSTSGAIKLQAAATTTNYTVKLPSAQGAASTFLQNDGSGNLAWTAVPNEVPSQTGNQYKVLATDGSAASWQFAGLGDGSYPSNTVVLGRGLPSLMTATSSVLIGTGSNLGTGTSQVIIGASSGRSTSGATGANNTVIGAGSFNNSLLTSAANNTIIGQGACTALRTGGDNVVIGKGAAISLTGGNNTIVGVDAGTSLAGGILNCIFGFAAGSSTTGQYNTILGPQSNCSSGSYNFIGGYQSGIATTGQYNIAIGTQSGNNTGSGSYNVVAGFQSLSAGGNTGSYNIALGYQACNNNGGSNNIALGYQALNSAATANNSCVAIGPYAGRYASGATGEFYLNNQNRTDTAGDKSKSLMYGTFNATETSQTLQINAQTNLRLGEKHASVHGQVGTLDVITATVNNYYIGVDSSLAAKTVNLPAAATAGAGFVLSIKDEGGLAGTNNITIDANGAELIDGATTQPINANYGSLNLMCSGTAWFII